MPKIYQMPTARRHTVTLTPDTHDPVVQSSAFVLVRLLESRFAGSDALNTMEIPSQISNAPFLASGGVSSVAVATQPQIIPARLLQGSFLRYVKSAILLLDSGSAAASESSDMVEVEHLRTDPRICDSLRFVEYVLHQDTEHLSVLDKRRIFEQLLVVAGTFAGGNWDDRQAQWSVNAFYHATTGSYEYKTTSPAHAFNLVCRALFDDSLRLNGEEISEEDRRARLDTLYQQLLRLQKEKERGEAGKCATGLQHDVLYVLNRGFPDERGAPLVLLSDTPAFITESLVLFLEEIINQHAAEPEFRQMLSSWISQRREQRLELSIFRLWLQKVYVSHADDNPDAAWKQACRDFIANRCAFVGLHFGTLPSVDAYVDEFDNVPIPQTEHTPVHIVELLERAPLLIPSSARGREGAISELMSVANVKLTSYQNSSPLLCCSLQANAYAGLFLRILTCAESLSDYAVMSALLGDDDAAFFEAREALSSALLVYLRRDEIDEDEFNRLSRAFYESKRRFLGQHHADFIANFFANLDGSIFGIRAQFGRLSDLGVGCENHPLLLTDDALLGLLDEIQEPATGAITVLNLSPYIINRVLLQACLQRPETWSPLLSGCLSNITQWLLDGQKSQDGLFAAFACAYPVRFLSHINLVSLYKGDCPGLARLLTPLDIEVCLSENIPALIAYLVEACLGAVEIMPHDRFVSYANKLSRHVETYSELSAVLHRIQSKGDVRDRFLDSFADRWHTLIQTTEQLIELLGLPLGVLPISCRTHLIGIFNEKLNEWTVRESHLCALFSLKVEQFPIPLRESVWAAMRTRLPCIIEHAGNLTSLLKLTHDQLDYDQRDDLLKAFMIRRKADNRPFNLGDLYGAYSLFALPSSAFGFEPMMRETLLSTVGLRPIRSFEMGTLLSCLRVIGSRALREKIVDAANVKGNLADLIDSYIQLDTLLFYCSVEQRGAIASEVMALAWLTEKQKADLTKEFPALVVENTTSDARVLADQGLFRAQDIPGSSDVAVGAAGDALDAPSAGVSDIGAGASNEAHSPIIGKPM